MLAEIGPSLFYKFVKHAPVIFVHAICEIKSKISFKHRGFVAMLCVALCFIEIHQ